jgi:hypothetical protein
MNRILISWLVPKVNVTFDCLAVSVLSAKGGRMGTTYGKYNKWKNMDKVFGREYLSCLWQSCALWASSLLQARWYYVTSSAIYHNLGCWFCFLKPVKIMPSFFMAFILWEA